MTIMILTSAACFEHYVFSYNMCKTNYTFCTCYTFAERGNETSYMERYII